MDRVRVVGDGVFRTMSTLEPKRGGPASVVETACPLDCPDACSLAVTVHGKVVKIGDDRKH